MRVHYVDTSALLKLLVQEDGSEEMAIRFADATVLLTSCELTITELMRSAGRSGADAGAVDILLGQLDLVSVQAALLRRAGLVPSPPGTFLRSADAIHIASALTVGAEGFITYDRRQADAAALQGFQVIAPSPSRP